MSLLTPSFGLIFWMVLIFTLVFIILAKFGFPAITTMVDKRSNHIADSLKAAQQAQDELKSMTQEQARMLEETRLEQGRILKEAAESRDKIISQAKEQAQVEADKLIQYAKTEIAAERESAVRDISHQVSLISVEVAEKIIRKDLSEAPEQVALVDRMVEEASKIKVKS